MNARQFGSLAVKLTITIGLLSLLAKKIDLQAVVIELRSLQVFWAMTATVLLFAQLILTGVRWYIVSRLVSSPIGLGQAVRLVLIGQFFNQVLPTSLGGDAVRAWLLSREAVPFDRAVLGIICDRVAALVVLAVIVAATIPLLSSIGLHTSLLERLAVVAPAVTALGLLFLVFLGDWISEVFRRNRLLKPLGSLIGKLRIVLFASSDSGLVLGLALLVQVTMVLVLLACSMAMGLHPGAAHVLLFPSILLISMVPISFAGWGMREGTMVVLLGFAGVSAPEALAISLIFGLAQMVVGLPGGAMWLLRRRQNNAGDSSAAAG